MLNLVDYLSKVPDNRRGAGQRHNQVLVLLLVIMSTMSGYYGYRAIGDFIKRNHKELLAHFKPHKGRLPSFDTVRRILMVIDFKELSEQFQQWANSRVQLGKADWISLDGKVIGSTVKDAHGASQSFISLISAYCASRKFIIANGQVKHKKESEIAIVQQMIKELGLIDVTFSLDALHCQKKQQLSLLNSNAIM